MTRPKTRVDCALEEVKNELMAAQYSFVPFRSEHEGYAIVKEEVDELWDEIKKKPKERDLEKMRKEATQVAAMATRFMLDCTGDTYVHVSTLRVPMETEKSLFLLLLTELEAWKDLRPEMREHPLMKHLGHELSTIIHRFRQKYAEQKDAKE